MGADERLRSAQEVVAMSELSLRGMRIGSASSLSDRVTDLAPRARHNYTCPQGHTFSVALANDAAAPALWGCRCGEDAQIGRAHV